MKLKLARISCHRKTFPVGDFKGANPGEGQVICAQDEAVMNEVVLELLQEEDHLQQLTFHGCMCSLAG